MSSRDQILAKLRASRPPFPDAAPRPAHYLPVSAIDPTHADTAGLLSRFTAELTKLTGKVYDMPDAEAAIECVLKLIGADPSVIAWGDLPLPGLAEALSGAHISAIHPQPRLADRSTVLRQIEPIRVGITGAEAGLATSGTLALVTSPAHGRIVSLIPPVHIALLRRDRLFATMEAWIAAAGKAAIAQSSSVIFITGPSRTSDIEMQTIMGVHGPREVHVVVF